MQMCPMIVPCPFFNDNLPSVPSIAGALKRMYCEDDYVTCARFRVNAAGRPVPPDLFPNQDYRVGALSR